MVLLAINYLLLLRLDFASIRLSLAIIKPSRFLLGYETGISVAGNSIVTNCCFAEDIPTSMNNEYGTFTVQV
jgi:hypothetical protein